MNKIKTVCVYCGSSPGTNPRFIEAAAAFGKILGENGIRLVYGGGSLGLMGAVATAALDHVTHEARQNEHGEVREERGGRESADKPEERCADEKDDRRRLGRSGCAGSPVTMSDVMVFDSLEPDVAGRVFEYVQGQLHLLRV